MPATKRFQVCEICGHEIVEGVACDIQPEDCPFLKQDRQAASSEPAKRRSHETQDRPELHFVVGED